MPRHPSSPLLANSIHRSILGWPTLPRFRSMMRVRTWRSPLCRCTTLTRCRPRCEKSRVFSNRAVGFAWRSFIRVNSAGRFETDAADAPFVIKGDYLSASTYADTVERDGLSMTFHSQHRPIQDYFIALEEAGLLVEVLREPAVPDHAANTDRRRRWQRLFTMAVSSASSSSPNGLRSTSAFRASRCHRHYAKLISL
jgi:hypothetical protein